MRDHYDEAEIDKIKNELTREDANRKATGENIKDTIDGLNEVITFMGEMRDKRTDKREKKQIQDYIDKGVAIGESIKETPKAWTLGDLLAVFIKYCKEGIQLKKQVDPEV